VSPVERNTTPALSSVVWIVAKVSVRIDGVPSACSARERVWKRLGLAVIDGVRQGGLPKSASKDDWIAHGYSRVRRSRMFVIGDALIKANGEYRAVYLARKEYERQRAEAAGLTVAPALKIPKARANEFISDGIIHRRAQRYREKRLLRDLWQAWNRGKATPLLSHDETEQRVPAREPLAA
jgi:hypothetical protein